jgi:glutathione S-transferase
MRKIYGALLSRAGRTNWVAHECGLEFEQVHVPTRVPAEEKPADFMAINPAGTMPVYQDGDFVLKESLAIDLYLGRKYQPRLMGKDLEEEGKVYQWTLFAISDLENTVRNCLSNSGFDEHRPFDEAEFAKGKEQFLSRLAIVNDALKGREYLVGNAFTLADLHIAWLVAFPVVSSFSRDDLKNITPWFQKCASRPAFARSLPPEFLTRLQAA